MDKLFEEHNADGGGGGGYVWEGDDQAFEKERTEKEEEVKNRVSWPVASVAPQKEVIYVDSDEPPQAQNDEPEVIEVD